MIIKALCDYYDILAEDEESGISKFGYKLEAISFAIELDYDGSVLAVHSFDKKKTKMLVFNTGGRSGSGCIPYVLCDNSKYVLGKVFDKKTKDFISYNDHFKSFKDKQINLFENIEDDRVKAVLYFLEKISSGELDENLINTTDMYKDGMIVFRVDSKYIHNLDCVKKVFEKTLIPKESNASSFCMISGVRGEIASTHDKIKGVFGGQAAGTALVSFNANAFTSYDKEQNFNSPMSKIIADKYITTINYLIKSGSNKKTVGKTTVLIWASSKEYELSASDLFFGTPFVEEKEDRDLQNTKLEEKITSLIDRYKKGMEINNVLGIENSQFYILGLIPNNARVCIQFFYNNSYEYFLSKITQFHNEMQLVKSENYHKYIYFIDLLKSISTNDDKDNIQDSLKSSLFYAMTNGTLFPKSLYIKTIERIKAEVSKENGIRFSTQVSFIKAYLIRNTNIQNPKIKEEITMALNEELNSTPYVLGRMFAIFESVQYFANGSSNIRERYFQAASTNPKTIFSSIFNLYTHHLQKLNEGHKISVDRRIQDLVSRIDAFPPTLTLEEQGTFILGYYHQRQVEFSKKDKTENEEI